MKCSLKTSIVLAGLGLALLACQIPFSQVPAEEPVLPPTRAVPSAAPPAALVLNTPTATSPAAAEEPTRLAVTPTLKVNDFSAARIKLADLPQGFQELDPASQEKIGLTGVSLASLYTGAFSQAKPANYFTFINAASGSFEIVLGLLFSPLTQPEKISFDAELANKDLALQLFSDNLKAKADLIPGSDQIGEKSLGFTFRSTADAFEMRGDLFIVRRDQAVMLVMVLYQDGNEPPVQAARLAALWDAQLKLVLNH